MNICKYCGKPIEGELVMNPDVYGNGYHHFCLINKEFRDEQRRIYNKGKADALRWIPISERLPEDFQRVLVTVVNYNGNKVVRVAEYDNYKGVFRIKENHEEWEIGEKGLLAWMPLPEPYQTESEVEK